MENWIVESARLLIAYIVIGQAIGYTVWKMSRRDDDGSNWKELFQFVIACGAIWAFLPFIMIALKLHDRWVGPTESVEKAREEIAETIGEDR